MSVSKVVSIEVSDVCTRVCEIAYNKKNPTIYKSVIFDNPEFSVDDGFVMNRPAYGGELKDQLRTAGIKCKDVVFVLSSNKIVNKEVIIPDMKEELIPDLIESEKNDYFPMDVSEDVFSFTIIEKLKETKQQRIVVYACPDVLIKNYQALAAELDMKIAAIDYSGNATYTWLLRKNHEPLGMYLQVNEKNTMFTIMDNGLLDLQRNMNFGAYTLTANVRDNGLYGNDITDVNALIKMSEAPLIYSSFVESEDARPETEAQEKEHLLKARLTDACRPLIGNISRVLEYYNAKKRGAVMQSTEAAPAAEGAEKKPTTTKLYLGGIGGRIKGLKELIESEFNGIEVVILDKLPGIVVHKKDTYCANHSTEMVASIGAATQTINFYKGDAKKETNKTIVLCIIGLAAVIIASAIIVLNGKIEYDNAVTEQNRLQIQQAELEATGIEALEQQYINATNSAAEVVAMDEGTFNHNENWNDILSYIEDSAVSSMLVSSLSSTDSSLSLNLTVNTKEEAAKLIQQLQKIPYFEKVAVNGITETIEEETGNTTVAFSVVCTYQKPVEEQAEEEVTE